MSCANPMRNARSICSMLVTWTCIACALVGCGDDEKKTTAAAGSGKSWGGEVVDESDGIAKPATHGTTPQVQNEGEPVLGPTEDYRPVVPDAPPVQTEEKQVEITKGPSAWGATDAESGKPLPKRNKPNKKALEEIRAGKKSASDEKLADARKHFELALSADPRADRGVPARLGGTNPRDRARPPGARQPARCHG